MHKQRILVTDANGFLGSYVLETFAKFQDIHLIAAVRNISKLPANFSGEVCEGDLRDKTYVQELVKNVDVICHTAAWTSLWRHKKQEQHYFRDPSLALIDAAVAAGVKRFIWDSSVVLAEKTPKASIRDNAPAQGRNFWPHLNAMAEIENHMQQQSGKGTKMIALRCGHFIGPRSNLGVITVLLPRLKTHLVPWVSGGQARQPLVAGEDLAQAFYLAATKSIIDDFISLNICGPSFPSMHEIISFLHQEAKTPLPHYNVPLWGAYAFGWLMETLHRVIPGQPLLTRPIAYLGENHYAPNMQADGFPKRALAGSKSTLIVQ